MKRYTVTVQLRGHAKPIVRTWTAEHVADATDLMLAHLTDAQKERVAQVWVSDESTDPIDNAIDDAGGAFTI